MEDRRDATAPACHPNPTAARDFRFVVSASFFNKGIPPTAESPGDSRSAEEAVHRRFSRTRRTPRALKMSTSWDPTLALRQMVLRQPAKIMSSAFQ